jgi:hypothetical protein
MSDTVKITLTDARPILVKKNNWPLVAKASHDRDHNNQEIFRRHFLRVRLHAKQGGPGDLKYYGGGKDGAPSLDAHKDGRCVVYGWYESSYQGESGSQAGYACTLDDVVEKIRRVGEAIGAEEWLIMECISDLPEVVEPEDAETGLPAEITIRIGVKTEQQAKSLVDSMVEWERSLRADAAKFGLPGCVMADDVATVRRNLQERAGLVLTHAEVATLVQ